MPSKMWRGSWYMRTRSRTWRNANTGQVISGNPTGPGTKRRLGYEFRKANRYGSDPRPITAAQTRARDFKSGDEPVSPAYAISKREPLVRPIRLKQVRK